ncbi:MAG: hypothetical protein ACI8RD_005928 [Bacillariaceae sp.]|jgi:hypothetical protein
MIFKFYYCWTVALVSISFCDDVKSFRVNHPNVVQRRRVGGGPSTLSRDTSSSSSSSTSLLSSPISTSTSTSMPTSSEDLSIWEKLARGIFGDDDFSKDIEKTKAYTNTVSLLRVGIPSFIFAASAKISHPYISLELANAINDSGVFAVVSQDASQYIQNILTTSGLTFSILVGQTYYFMYQVSTTISYTVYYIQCMCMCMCVCVCMCIES